MVLNLVDVRKSSIGINRLFAERRFIIFILYSLLICIFLYFMLCMYLFNYLELLSPLIQADYYIFLFILSYLCFFKSLLEYDQNKKCWKLFFPAFHFCILMFFLLDLPSWQKGHIVFSSSTNSKKIVLTCNFFVPWDI